MQLHRHHVFKELLILYKDNAWDLLAEHLVLSHGFLFFRKLHDQVEDESVQVSGESELEVREYDTPVIHLQILQLLLLVLRVERMRKMIKNLEDSPKKSIEAKINQMDHNEPFVHSCSIQLLQVLSHLYNRVKEYNYRDKQAGCVGC